MSSYATFETEASNYHCVLCKTRTDGRRGDWPWDVPFCWSDKCVERMNIWGERRSRRANRR